MHMNEDQLGSMWRYLSTTSHARILQLTLEEVLQDQPDRVSDQGACENFLDSRSKIRGEDLVNT